ncbi:MAG: nucleotidyl transferase AbiEii/AbiGii toxin family protein [bacterium]
MKNFVLFSPEERKLYFEQTAFLMKVASTIIEKDFWVCYTLSKLFSLPNIEQYLIFKGGTTLSKAYGIIERFSEDIDISIDRKSLGGRECDPAEVGIGTKEKQRRLSKLQQLCRQKIDEEIKPLLLRTIREDVAPANNWALVKDNTDPDEQTLLFVYPSVLAVNKDGYIKPAVKIEMGARSDHSPSEICTIASYVAQTHKDSFKGYETKVKVLSAQRTFWEKATLLHAEYHRPLSKIMPARLSRHYYDMAMLIDKGVPLEEKLLGIVVEHKKIFFRSLWAKYDEAKKGTLRIFPNSERIKLLEADYKKMEEMFFVKPPAFSEILNTLLQWEKEFNNSK